MKKLMNNEIVRNNELLEDVRLSKLSKLELLNELFPKKLINTKTK